MITRTRLTDLLMREEDWQYLRKTLSEEDWEDGLDAAIRAKQDNKEVTNHRDFREVWRVRMKHAGIHDPNIYTMAMMAKDVFKFLS